MHERWPHILKQYLGNKGYYYVLCDKKSATQWERGEDQGLGS